VPRNLAQQIKQTRPFASQEQEAPGNSPDAASLLAPWETFFNTKFCLSTGLFNVLRILRGRPLHIHHQQHETIYFLKESHKVQLGDDVFRCEAGGFVYIPIGVRHAS